MSTNENITNENITNENTKIKYILESISLNYKSWILLFVCIYIIYPSNFIYSFLTYFIMMIIAHLFHYWSHLGNNNFGNCVHIYHHENTNWFSHFIQMNLEFIVLLFPIILKYYLSMFSFINEWIILFFYFLYTTVHNVNYSIFHINHVHELHHELLIKNMGPDLCDILFDTKYKPENGIENTDHYIPNILLATILILFMQYIWKNSENNDNSNNSDNSDNSENSENNKNNYQEIYKKIFGILFIISIIIHLYASIILFIF